MRRILLICLIVSPVLLKGQSVLDSQLNGSEKGQQLVSVLDSIQSNSSFQIFFLQEWLNDITVEQSYVGQSLKVLIDDLFQGTELSYVLMYPEVLVIVRDPSYAKKKQAEIQIARSSGIKIDQIILGSPSVQQANSGNVTITGTVMDWVSGDNLPFTSIQVNDSLRVVSSDSNGKFQFSVPKGNYLLKAKFVDYEDKLIDLLAFDNGDILVELEKEAKQLDEVVVEADREEELSRAKIGKTVLTVKEMKYTPSFLGEVDLVRQVQNLPGVTTVGEAATGFNVRGGSVDQNLILYDGLPVFNSSHVFGFLTSFNPDAVENVTFYKGGVPAQFGGRVSSVLDIEAKEGDYEEWSGKAGIGMITSNVSVSGPIKEGETSISASLRSTYSNWLARSVRTDYADLRESNVFFYDGTVKLTHKFNEDNKLSFTGYSSHDAFKLVGDTTYRWNTNLASVNYDKQYSPDFGAKFTAGISNYDYNVEDENFRTASRLRYRLTAATTSAKFFKEKEGYKIDFGAHLNYYNFQPGELSPTSDVSNAANFSLDKQNSIELAVFIDDSWEVNDRLTLNAGLRIPFFMSLGAADIYEYDNDDFKQVTGITDTLEFGSFEPIKSYVGLEPRFSMNYKLSETTAFKIGYNRIFQYLHLVTNTTAVTPIDIWQPSGYYFEPQRADQVSAGLFRNSLDNKFGVSVEGFYKHINNLVDFKDGAELTLNDHIETELLQGTGRAYGAELALMKNSGKLTGTLNYTYSRSFRTIGIVGDRNASINNGLEYPSNFDQPHVINFNWKLEVTKRHFLTGSFTYQSGRPVTIPLSLFNIDNNFVAFFSERNQFRIPDYHRLDLGLVIEGSHNKRRWAKGTWIISIYNAYSRQNPYTVFFGTSDLGIPEPFQLSIIGTILPSISYNLNF